MAGYSGTPLVQKLGIKAGYNVAFVNAPPEFVQELDLPPGVKTNLRSKKRFDFVHLFTMSEKDLQARFSQWAAKLAPAGMLWVSWPKKSSGVETDLSENVVREIGLRTGLVDVKICAVDEVWSGLKFVIRVKDRPKALDPKA